MIEAGDEGRNPILSRKQRVDSQLWDTARARQLVKKAFIIGARTDSCPLW